MTSGTPDGDPSYETVWKDYRTLLADGIVGFTRSPTPSFEADHRTWASTIIALAEADGLQAGLFYMHGDVGEMWATNDGAIDPCVHLLHGDHSSEPNSNIYPYDQQAAAAWFRPRAEVEWGESLVAARIRHSS
ncbi:MAG TPA: hypothetical protein VLJ44_00255 [Gaiellaceae bacterium]|nr:hypothetical protein [Gaiellaceae bacterium]